MGAGNREGGERKNKKDFMNSFFFVVIKEMAMMNKTGRDLIGSTKLNCDTESKLKFYNRNDRVESTSKCNFYSFQVRN